MRGGLLVLEHAHWRVSDRSFEVIKVMDEELSQRRA